MRVESPGTRAIRATITVTILVLTLRPPQAYGSVPPSVVISTPSGGSTFTWSDSYRVVEHHLPNGSSNPWAIAVDPRGRPWFVAQGTNQLGEYDPRSGTFEFFGIPTPRSNPISVASDSLGNIWVSELSTGNLAELQYGGARIVEFHVPGATVSLGGTGQTVDCGPGAIATDPSGRVWVACLFSNQIDEFFPVNGTFDQYNLPVFQSGPAGIVLDGRGNLWFTAADADMIGKAVLGQLRNGTSDGIAEFAPINQTYVFQFEHLASFSGATTTVTSSLPTPSGIAISPDGTRLWITEHVDSSFDSYSPGSGSLVRYWTSQTNGAYGQTVSFPNGVAVDRNGTVWVGEHYGNKIAEFNPATGQMTEYLVPCCSSSIAGVYSVALDGNGTLWFVEIQGDVVGEMSKVRDQSPLSISLPRTAVQLDSRGSASTPVTFSLPATAKNSTRLSIAASGVTSTGALENMSATSIPTSVEVAPGGSSSSNLTLALDGLSPGVYYLTLTASTSPRSVFYSVILKLTVTEGPPLPLNIVLPAVLGLTALAVFVAWRLRRNSAPRRRTHSLSWQRPLS
jgi:streptogramin lyase